MPMWLRVVFTAWARSSLVSTRVPSRSKIRRSISTRRPSSACASGLHEPWVCGARPGRTPPFSSEASCDVCPAACWPPTGCPGCDRGRAGSCFFPRPRRPHAAECFLRENAPPTPQIFLSFFMNSLFERLLPGRFELVIRFPKAFLQLVRRHGGERARGVHHIGSRARIHHG